jgi:hypothetical protein
MEVRRDDLGQGQHLGDERGARRGLEQRVAGLRDHDGVEHDGPAAVRAQTRGHRLDDGGRRQHPDLDRVGADIRQHGIDLSRHELGRDVEHAVNAQGVLGGQRGDHRGAEDPERRERLEVCLDAGAATGIGAGDGQRCGHGHLSRSIRARWRPHKPRPPYQNVRRPRSARRAVRVSRSASSRKAQVPRVGIAAAAEAIVTLPVIEPFTVSVAVSV